MTPNEKYLFDLNGFLLVKRLLDDLEVNEFRTAVDDLESYVQQHIDAEPQLGGFSDIRYRFSEEHECFSYKSASGGGLQFVVDDFLNASSAFDKLVGHPATMKYVEELGSGPFRIGNSEIRYRYRSNTTPSHMGGNMDARNRYEFVGRSIYDANMQKRLVRDFDLLAVRFLYALHDIPVENGPLCVVPGSHKSNYFSPYSDDDPTNEPGMIPIPMKAGDALIFTENLRHGGFPNLLDTPRKTLHLMFAPAWVGSQSPIHWNDHVHVSQRAWDRYTPTQRALLPPPRGTAEIQVKQLQGQIAQLKDELAGAKSEVDRLQKEQAIAQAAQTPKTRFFLGRIFRT